MTDQKRKPAAPFYAVAALWLLSGALLPLYRASHYAILSAVSAAVFLAVHGLCRGGGVLGGGQEEKQAEAKASPAPAETELDKMLQEGRQAIAEMKRLDANIAAPGISADIVRLEQVSGKIFQAVQDDPEKLPQIRRFMDYYLPTVLKLLKAYDRMSNAGVSGENISKSLIQIETMMRTIVIAFGKQLDSLYSADALDISADIRVLETMMAREGLSGEPELKADQPGGTDIRLEL